MSIDERPYMMGQMVKENLLIVHDKLTCNKAIKKVTSWKTLIHCKGDDLTMSR